MYSIKDISKETALPKRVSIKFKLACGHEEIVPTDLYQFSKTKANKLFDEMKEKGTLCPKCGQKTYPLEIIR